MIRSIRLQNWRAYRDVTIDLDYPMVFFVAPNGVGKTSLFEAARWCLLGVPTGRKAARAVRSDKDEALVSLELRLSDDSEVTVTRNLTRGGRVSFMASHDGEPLQDDAFSELLRTQWAVDPSLLDKLVFGEQPAHAVESAFPVRDHLAAVLGVTPLLEAARALDHRRKEARKAVASVRQNLDGIEEALGKAEAQTEAAQLALKRAVAERQPLTVEIEGLEALVAAAGSWDMYRADVESYTASGRALIEEMTQVVSVDADAPRRSVEDAIRETERSLEETRARSAEADLEAVRSAHAADLLSPGTTECPTCLRPLAEHERLHALNLHGKDTSAASTEAERLRSEVDRIQRRVEAILAFARRLDRLHEPTRPDVDDPGPEVGTRLAEMREADHELAENIGQLRTELDASERHQAEVREAVEDQAALHAAAREELLLETTRDVLMGAADRYLTGRIEPLVRDITHRWKLLFGFDGLTLDPSGELRLKRGDLDLGMADLSGGERATAMIITRLLVTASTTHVTMVWFDEPLEHLDPRRRAAVAHTFVRAAQAHTVSQIVVTTYEESIARRLASAMPDDVHVVYADTDPVT